MFSFSKEPENQQWVPWDDSKYRTHLWNGKNEKKYWFVKMGRGDDKDSAV